MESAGGKEVPKTKVKITEEKKTDTKILDHDERLSREISSTEERLAATVKMVAEVEKNILLLTRDATVTATNTLSTTRKWKAECEEQIARAERAVVEIDEQKIAKKTTRKKIVKMIDSIVSAISTLVETKKWMEGYIEHVENIKRHNDETEELIAKRPDTTLPWEERAELEIEYQQNMTRVCIASAISSLGEVSRRKYNYAEFLEQIARAKSANAVIEEQIAKKNTAVNTIGQKSAACEEIAKSRRDADETEEQIPKKNNTLTTTGQKSIACEEKTTVMSKTSAGEEKKRKRAKKKKTETTNGQICEEEIAMFQKRDEFDEEFTHHIERLMAKDQIDKNNKTVTTTGHKSAACEEIAMSKRDVDEIKKLMAKNNILTTTGQKSIACEEEMSKTAAGEGKKRKRPKKKKTATTIEPIVSEEEIALLQRVEFGEEFQQLMGRMTAMFARMDPISHEDDEEASMTWTVELEGHMDRTATKRKHR